MAPFHRPRRLYDVCISTVAQRLNEVCENLATKHESYEIEECKHDIGIIREFLSSTIPFNAMEDLYYIWRYSSHDYDTRIRAATFMHKGMKTLRILYGKNKWTQYLESSFWVSQLSYSKYITSLSLDGICTDEILEGVSEHCIALKCINIRPARIKTSKDSDNDETYLHLVTDVGLGHLGKCKTLQGVEMWGYRTETMSVTIPGIRKLLKDLPVVKYMSFKNLGSVISEDMDDIKSLKLTYFHEHRPIPHHITALSRLCHNLKHICLNFTDSEENHDVKAAVLDAVTKSELCISDFELSNYGLDDNFVNLLHVKGMFLTRLRLDLNVISTILIKLIGLYCGNIRILCIWEWGSDETDMIENLEFDMNTITFPKLECLTLVGMFWDASAILRIILPHAQNIIKLDIDTNFFIISNTVENTINDILSQNPLTKLTKLCAGFYLHMPTLLYFIRLPHITDLNYWHYTGYITQSEFENVIKEELINRDLSFGASWRHEQ